MAIKIGTKAPAIALKTKTENGIESVSLTRSVGSNQTLIIFVPLAFSGGCTAELCTIKQTLHAYASVNADVLVVSVDSPFALDAWKRQEHFPMTMLSDFNREAVAAYGVMDEKFLPEVLNFCGVAKRSAFVIDKLGIIKYAWSSDDPHDMPPFEEIRKALGCDE